LQNPPDPKMEKPGGPKGTPRHLKPAEPDQERILTKPTGVPKVARMALKRKRCVMPFPTFWRGFFVPRTQRSAPFFTISAFTRVFDALWWCAAEPGP
jgi:hypothetical protein